MVVGTGTEVGKTWVAARLLEDLRGAGVTVAARKPVQSFGAGDAPDATDAAVLGRATGEDPVAVCPAARWFPVPMAPPMAAEVLGREQFSLADLVAELQWPPGVGVGLVESAGGVRSPLACDGDSADLAPLLDPDVVVLVADAGLGTINAVRLSAQALAPDVVVLNRYRADEELHRRNADWLERRDGQRVVRLPGERARLVDLVLSPPGGRRGAAGPAGRR